MHHFSHVVDHPSNVIASHGKVSPEAVKNAATVVGHVASNPAMIAAQITKPMKPVQDILQHHIDYNQLKTTPGALAETLQNALKNGFKLIRFGNVLFTVKRDPKNVLFSIINGDTPKDYVRALRKFVDFFKSKGAKHFMIYVQDQNSATSLGKAAGLKNLKFQNTRMAQEDPYLMIGEA